MKNCAQLQKWIFYLFIQNPKCASHSKWCHQMLQNDVIKCCKMMSPHSNEPATWRNCVSRRHFFTSNVKTLNHCLFPDKSTSRYFNHFSIQVLLFWHNCLGIKAVQQEPIISWKLFPIILKLRCHKSLESCDYDIKCCLCCFLSFLVLTLSPKTWINFFQLKLRKIHYKIYSCFSYFVLD